MFDPKPMTDTMMRVEYISVMRMVSHESHKSDPSPLFPKTISTPMVMVKALLRERCNPQIMVLKLIDDPPGEAEI